MVCHLFVYFAIVSLLWIEFISFFTIVTTTTVAAAAASSSSSTDTPLNITYFINDSMQSSLIDAAGNNYDDFDDDKDEYNIKLTGSRKASNKIYHDAYRNHRRNTVKGTHLPHTKFIRNFETISFVNSNDGYEKNNDNDDQHQQQLQQQQQHQVIVIVDNGYDSNNVTHHSSQLPPDTIDSDSINDELSMTYDDGQHHHRLHREQQQQSYETHLLKAFNNHLNNNNDDDSILLMSDTNAVLHNSDHVIKSIFSNGKLNHRSNNNQHRHQHKIEEPKNAKSKKQQHHHHHQTHWWYSPNDNIDADNVNNKTINVFTPLPPSLPYQTRRQNIAVEDENGKNQMVERRHSSVQSNGISMLGDSGSSSRQPTKYGEEFIRLPHSINARHRHAKRWNRNHMRHIATTHIAHDKTKALFHAIDDADSIGHNHRQHYFSHHNDNTITLKPETQSSIMLAADRLSSQLIADMEFQVVKQQSENENNMNGYNINNIAGDDKENVSIHWPVKKEAIMEGDVILGKIIIYIHLCEYARVENNNKKKTISYC